MRNIWQWTGVVIFLAAGLWCLLGPQRLQRQAIEADTNLKIHPFRTFIRNRSYVTVARIVGASSILIALLLMVALFLGQR